MCCGVAHIRGEVTWSVTWKLIKLPKTMQLSLCRHKGKISLWILQLYSNLYPTAEELQRPLMFSILNGVQLIRSTLIHTRTRPWHLLPLIWVQHSHSASYAPFHLSLRKRSLTKIIKVKLCTNSFGLNDICVCECLGGCAGVCARVCVPASG